MTEQIRHNCGFCVAHSLETAYNFTESFQHRGREAAGLAAVGKDRIDVIKWKGIFKNICLKFFLNSEMLFGLLKGLN